MSNHDPSFLRRKKRVGNKLKAVSSPDAKRISVFRSNKHIYVQVIDDKAGGTLVSSSTVQLKIDLTKIKKMDAAHEVGLDCAAKMKEKNITRVFFHKSGYKFHGRIKQVATAMRSAGISF
jgi:large subunit ribosomal protein L18